MKPPRLSQKRIQILRYLIVDGLSIKQIADLMGRSAKTVDSHIGDISKALGLPYRNPWVCARVVIALGILETGVERVDRALKLERAIKQIKEIASI